MRTQLIGTVAAAAVIAISSFMTTGAYADGQNAQYQNTAPRGVRNQVAQANPNRNRNGNRGNRANRRRNGQAGNVGNGGNRGNRRARGNRGGQGAVGPQARNNQTPRANRQGNRRGGARRGNGARQPRGFVNRGGRWAFQRRGGAAPRGRFNFRRQAPASRRANVNRRVRGQVNRNRVNRNRAYRWNRGYRNNRQRYANRAPRHAYNQGYGYPRYGNGRQYQRYVYVGRGRCYDRYRGRYVRCYPRNRHRPNLGLVILGAVLHGLAHRNYNRY